MSLLTAKEEKLACKIRATFSKPAFHSNVTHGGILFCLPFLIRAELCQTDEHGADFVRSIKQTANCDCLSVGGTSSPSFLPACLVLSFRVICCMYSLQCPPSQSVSHPARPAQKPTKPTQSGGGPLKFPKMGPSSVRRPSCSSVSHIFPHE